MKKQINEIRRMQQLAGLIKENSETEYSGPEWIDQNSPKATILTDVYYIGDNAYDDLSTFAGGAVPSYRLPGYTLEDIKEIGDGMLYIKNGEEGWYDENEGVFESQDENSTVAVDKKYIKFI